MAICITSAAGRLQLRTPELSDAPNLLERVRDPACVAFLPHLQPPRTFNVEGICKRIEGWRKSSSVSNLFVVIVCLADGQVIGDGGFEVIDLQAKSGEAGIMLNSGSSVRGHGYAVEALATMFDYAFENLELERITSRTLLINKPMQSLLENKFHLVAEYREVAAGTECVYTLLKQHWLDVSKDGKFQQVPGGK